jgi:hypothetical protein
MSEDGWNEWSRHVLHELVRLNECYEKIREGQQKLATDVAMLKVKSGIWGLIAGIIPSGIAIIYTIIRLGK